MTTTRAAESVTWRTSEDEFRFDRFGIGALFELESRPLENFLHRPVLEEYGCGDALHLLGARELDQLTHDRAVRCRVVGTDR